MMLTQKYGNVWDDEKGKSRKVWWVKFHIPNKTYITYPVPSKLTKRQIRKHIKRIMLYTRIDKWHCPSGIYTYGADFAKDKVFMTGFLNDPNAMNKSDFKRLYRCSFKT